MIPPPQTGCCGGDVHLRGWHPSACQACRGAAKKESGKERGRKPCFQMKCFLKVSKQSVIDELILLGCTAGIDSRGECPSGSCGSVRVHLPEGTRQVYELCVNGWLVYDLPTGKRVWYMPGDAFNRPTVEIGRTPIFTKTGRSPRFVNSDGRPVPSMSARDRATRIIPKVHTRTHRLWSQAGNNNEIIVVIGVRAAALIQRLERIAATG